MVKVSSRCPTDQFPQIELQIEKYKGQCYFTSPNARRWGYFQWQWKMSSIQNLISQLKRIALVSPTFRLSEMTLSSIPTVTIVWHWRVLARQAANMWSQINQPTITCTPYTLLMMIYSLVILWNFLGFQNVSLESHLPVYRSFIIFGIEGFFFRKKVFSFGYHNL